MACILRRASASAALALVLGLGIFARGQVLTAPYGTPATPPADTRWAGHAPVYDTAPPAGDYRYHGAWNQSAPCATCAPAAAEAQPCGPNAQPCAPVTADAATCGALDECASPYVWAGGVGALLFDRDDGNHHFFSYDSANETDQLLDSRDAELGFGSGVEARIARFDCCTCTGFEAVYWGLFPTDETAYAFAGDVAGDLNPILNFDQLDYNGSAANAFVNDALVHRLRRESEIHNAEINLLRGFAGDDCGCSPWTVCGLAGFRYFRFEEALEFAADTEDTAFTGDEDELYYNIDVDNDLFGLQLGGSAEHQTGDRWSILLGAKAGVFVNSASARSRIGGAAGLATVNNGPNDGREWLVSADKEDVAFLGEVNAGLACRIGQTWRVLGEYRVVGVSGVALPTNQIFPDLRGLQDVSLLATNGNLLLHGVFIGVERVY